MSKTLLIEQDRECYSLQLKALLQVYGKDFLFISGSYQARHCSHQTTLMLSPLLFFAAAIKQQKALFQWEQGF